MKGSGMTAFAEKVKGTVTANFDQSCRMYREFEQRYGLFAALALELADRIGLREKAEVLDVGCGNGASARALNHQLGCRVLGVDLSPAMVADGRALSDQKGIELVVGDGERLNDVVADRTFDYVLYNASIFIFPEAATSLSQAAACLRPGGKIAFSFYPRLLAERGEDLIDAAFNRLDIPPPRFRTITSYRKACKALSTVCETVTHHEWHQPLDVAFMQAFFTIPAQSASLFPGRQWRERRQLVRRLFDSVRDLAPDASVIWRMAEGHDIPPAGA
jgi:SAM-dependent methyltransferase